MSELRSLIRSIFDTGVTISLGTIDTLKVRIVNRLTFIGGVVIVVLIGVNAFIGNYQGIVIDVAALVVVIVPVLWLNKQFHYRAAIYWFIVGTHLAVTAGTAHAILQGRDNGIEYLLIAGAFLIIVLLDRRAYRVLYLSNLLVLCGAVYFRLEDRGNFDEATYFKLIIIWSVVYLAIYFLVGQFKKQLMVVIEKLEKANMKLVESEMELKVSNRAKDRLFSIVAHDLKSPLNVLGQLLNPAIMEAIGREEMVKHQNTVRNRILFMEGSMRNLLDWAKHQLSNPEPKPVRVDLLPAVNHVVSLFEELMRQKELKAVIEVPEDFDVIIDVDHLEIVLRNILHNAVKFSPEKSSIFISASTNSEGKVVSIKDEGTGVDPEVVDAILNGKDTNPETGTKGERGSGVGLSFCVELLHKNNCELQIDSSEQGAIVKIILNI